MSVFIYDPLTDDKSGGNSSGIINWSDINGRPTFNNVSRRDVQKVVLKADGWDEDNKQSAAALTVVEDETKQYITSVPSNDSFDSYYDSNIMITGQGKGEVFFKADTKPTEDVNILLFIEETVNISEAYNGKWVWWSPKMTSNTTPEPYVVKTIPTDTSFLWRYFDNNNDTIADVIINEIYGVIIDFGSPTFISGIQLSSYVKDYFPKTFIFYGSNDGDEWTEIYTANGNEYDSIINNQKYPFFFKIIKYRYYKFGNITIWNNSEKIMRLREIEFYKWEEAEQ